MEWECCGNPRICNMSFEQCISVLSCALLVDILFMLAMYVPTLFEINTDSMRTPCA